MLKTRSCGHKILKLIGTLLAGSVLDVNACSRLMFKLLIGATSPLYITVETSNQTNIKMTTNHSNDWATNFSFSFKVSWIYSDISCCMKLFCCRSVPDMKSNPFCELNTVQTLYAQEEKVGTQRNVHGPSLSSVCNPIDDNNDGVNEKSDQVEKWQTGVAS